MGIGAGAGAAIGGALSAAGGVAGSLIGGQKAGGGASQNEYLQALQMNQNIVNTSPFIQAGQIAAQQLPGAIGVPMDLSGQPTVADLPQAPAAFNVAAPTAPDPFSWNPTMAGLAQTPGYQFALQQGQQAAQTSAAARGLGVSGAAMRGAADYATGLASNTYTQQLNNAIDTYNVGLNRYGAQNQGYGQQINAYNANLSRYGNQLQGFGLGQGAYQNQFNDYWANQQNKFNQLNTLATLGANVSVNQGSQNVQSASNIGNAAQQAAQYQGAGIANAGNALAGTLNSPSVQNFLTGSGTGANNQSVTGGGIFNSFSGIGPYVGGYGSYYQPPNPISQANYAPGNQGGGLL